MKNKQLLKITLLLASMMTMMAGAIMAPSLPQIEEVFSDNEYISLLSRLVITLPAAFIAVFSVVFGFLTDRMGRKKLLLFSLILYALGGSSGFFLTNIWLILVGRAVLGIAVAGIMTIVTTLIGDYFTGKERDGFAGLQGAFIGVGGIIFISVAGILADIQWQMPFLIYLFSVPIFIMAILYIAEPKLPGTKKNERLVKVDYNKTLSWLICFLAFLGIVFFYMIPVQIPFILEGFENSNNTQIGIAISLSTLTSAVTAMNYARVKNLFTYRQIFQLAMVFLGIGYLVVSVSSTFYSILVAMAISGIGIGLLMPTGNLWILAVSPEQIRGTLVGRLSTASFTGMFISPLIFQPIINGYNVATAFLVAGIAMGATILILFGVRTKM